MTRIISVLLVTNFVHAAQMEKPIGNPEYTDGTYLIMTSKLKSTERRQSYRILFGDDDDIKYSDHLDAPREARAEILKLRAQFLAEEGSEHKREACDKILLLFPY